MNLLGRYKRLNLWNKVAFWGSACSVLGLLLFLISPSSSQNKTETQANHSPGTVVQNAIGSSNVVQIGTLNINQPLQRDIPPKADQRQESTNPVTEQDLINFSKRLDQTIANRHTSSSESNLFDQILPGVSVQFVLRLGKQIEGRDNFIYDAGENLQKNRFSVFVDQDGNLCSRIIDKDSVPTSVKVSPALDTFDFGNMIFLICEYGSSDNFSFVRMLINGRQVAETHKDEAITISRKITPAGSVVGADLSGTNGGVFWGRDWSSSHATVNSSQVAAMVRILSEFYVKRKVAGGVYFDGHSYGRIEGTKNPN